jgi:hypothetical protein
LQKNTLGKRTQYTLLLRHFPLESLNSVLARVASRFGISVRYRLVFSRYFPNRYRRKTWLVHFGIIHLAGTPFSLASAPFLMDQAPLLRGVPAKFHKMELPPNLTVQKIPYIPYRIYQPASAGNLPIPVKLPVNRWDATLPYLPGHKHHLKDKVRRSKSSVFSCRVKCQECMGST